MRGNAETLAAFLRQNTGAAAGLTPDDVRTLMPYTEHHAGGLFVAWRAVPGTGLSVKMHDSWADPDEQGRDVVVHVYSSEDDSHDVVNYYADGHEALAAFLAADADTTEQ